MAAPIELGAGASNVPSGQEAGSQMALKAVKRTMTEILRDWHDFMRVLQTIVVIPMVRARVGISTPSSAFCLQHRGCDARSADGILLAAVRNRNWRSSGDCA
jgi:hypothetical protein